MDSTDGTALSSVLWRRDCRRTPKVWDGRAAIFLMRLPCLRCIRKKARCYAGLLLVRVTLAIALLLLIAIAARTRALAVFLFVLLRIGRAVALISSAALALTGFLVALLAGSLVLIPLELIVFLAPLGSIVRILRALVLLVAHSYLLQYWRD
jgi:hypothetical protein